VDRIEWVSVVRTAKTKLKLKKEEEEEREEKKEEEEENKEEEEKGRRRRRRRRGGKEEKEEERKKKLYIRIDSDPHTDFRFPPLCLVSSPYTCY
jgi:hypothetical protein